MEDTSQVDRSSSLDLFNSLQTRADVLVQEVRSYQAHINQQKREYEVGSRTFVRDTEAEVSSLKKLNPSTTPSDVAAPQNVDRNVEEEEGPRLTTLRSSNLPFFFLVRGVAKKCRRVTAIRVKIGWKEPKNTIGQNAHHQMSMTQENEPASLQKRSVFVDVVAEGGLEWIKVSTLNEKRLLFEMAKEGWEKYSGSDDGTATDSEDDDLQERDPGAGKLELVRLAENLARAAKATRVRFRHPHIKFVLPNIREGVLKDIDSFIAEIRSTGAVVVCGKDVDQFLADGRLDLDRMMPVTADASLTSTINVDETILLALISDICHLSPQQLCSIPTRGPRGAPKTHYKSIANQIAEEQEAPMLRDELYPLLTGRDLDCTAIAAQRFRKIVEKMATSSEQKRAAILLGEGQYKDQPLSVLREAFGEGSLHCVPDSIHFPVRIIQVDIEELLAAGGDPAATNALVCKGFPTSIAARTKDTIRHSTILSSAFLYGWARQVTTLTSNRRMANGLIKDINNVLDTEERQGRGYNADFVGPIIHKCKGARSLIGQDKNNEA
ncbi:hypothetical protein H2200_012636 [Cladophialophora chaetospira]|uniref:DUF1308 domain-containing protein n=1 Tax=Cladophialophora chaetospira TaxID=386627 RepID=A0AA39CC64_9EURO|nr:hypothetical protein H2200_012636 [Cladophialophora chaetospira]